MEHAPAGHTTQSSCRNAAGLCNPDSGVWEVPLNYLDLGEIDGIPRLLDMGQCNNAYSAIQVAGALADAFKCGVNDLPLSLVLSWFEQKAVSILLTLLHLGIKDIRLGRLCRHS